MYRKQFCVFLCSPHWVTVSLPLTSLALVSAPGEGSRQQRPVLASPQERRAQGFLREDCAWGGDFTYSLHHIKDASPVPSLNNVLLYQVCFSDLL